MKRMTTDNPQLNIERLLNTARAENNQAVLRLGDEVITLAEYVTKCAKEYGCNVTQESVMDGDNCAECDCPIAVLNILGIQAAENNARLKMIEKILGNDYDLNRLEQLLEACKGLEPNEIDESKFLIATQKDTGKMTRLRELAEADREGRCAVLLCKPGDKIWVIERDRNKEAESIAEYIFLSQVKDCIIAGFIDMSDDADIILEEQVRQTLFDYNGSLPVFPACDCYLDKDSALNMMKEKENNES